MQSNTRWKVVTWNTKTDRTFDTREQAYDYIITNDDEGDWYMEPEQTPNI